MSNQKIEVSIIKYDTSSPKYNLITYKLNIPKLIINDLRLYFVPINEVLSEDDSLDPFIHTIELITSEENLERFFDGNCPIYSYSAMSKTYRFNSWNDLVSFVKLFKNSPDYISSFENKSETEKLEFIKDKKITPLMSLAEIMYDNYVKLINGKIKY